MADTIEKPATDAGYEADFYLWTQQQAATLREAGRARVNAPVDWENVAEEIESVGGRDRRELRSLLRHIYVHLLKLAVSPSLPPRDGWMREIGAARQQVELLLDDSPSLRREVASMLEKDWSRIRELTEADLESFGEKVLAVPALDTLFERGPSAEAAIDERFFLPAVNLDAKS